MKRRRERLLHRVSASVAHVRGHRRVADQDGFALLATLAVIAFTSIILIAILGLTYTTATYSGQQVVRDRQTRAGDSAIRSVIDVLANEATTVGSPQSPDPCVLATPTATGTAAGNQPTVRVNGVDVVVTCTPQSPDRPPVAEEPSSEQLMVVGAGYKYNACDPSAPTTRSFGCLAGIADTTTGGGPAAFARAQVASNGSTVLHSGPGALFVSSDMSVRKSAAAVRNPAAGGSRLNGPALGVSGLYRQGDLGFQGTSTSPCGVQTRTNAATAPVWIDTIGLAPRCSNPQVTSLTPTNTSLTNRATWTAQQLSSPPALPACDARNVITISPGAYGAAQTATLNQWFGASACNGKIFYFKPGNYYFDVDTGSTSDPFAHSLVFDDPTSVVVFGSPGIGGAWNPGIQGSSVSAVWGLAPAGKACTPGPANGVSITLSSRTSLQHRRGRVAICDQRDDPKLPVPAIWQTNVMTAPFNEATPTGATNTVPVVADTREAVSFVNVGNVTADDGQSARATDNCDLDFSQVGGFEFMASWPQWVRNIFAGGRVFCRTYNAGFTVGADQWSGTGFPATTNESPIDSVSLAIDGGSNNTDFAGAQIVVKVSGPNLAQTNILGDRACTVTSAATSGVSRTIDLLDPSAGDCVSYIRDLGNLRGATVSVQFRSLRPSCPQTGFYGWIESLFGYNVNKGRCESDLNKRPWIEVDTVKLSARKLDVVGPTTAPFRVTSNLNTMPWSATATASTDATFNVYGATSIPMADLDVRWLGAPTTLPIFGGTTIVSAIASSAPTTQTVPGTYDAVPGLLCCTQATPSERVVTLNAWTDLHDVAGVAQGRLVASARIGVQDWKISLGGQPVRLAGSNLRVDSWRLCSSPVSNFVDPWGAVQPVSPVNCRQD